MARMGLDGRGFVMILMGFGCNVPALMGTRVMRSRALRWLSMLVIPFSLCSARLQVFIFIITALFTPQQAPLVLFFMYLASFAAAFLVPLPLLERELARLYDQHGMDRARCTLELMQSNPESEWLWRKRVLPMITRRFGISLSAAVFRCREIQPLISNAKPLLRQNMVDRLLKATAADADLDSIEIVSGIPKHCDLFSTSERGVPEAQ